ncbi:MAG: ABC transporter permease [Candidatus Heimdallarchaeum endolithica]|uniref:ABC transporter permease n=1 Tax=Candidatus Heimdallarchaeum endolithica TaxID=2876572 RepID=A0A9Y1FMD0_9ARCH|nr:MAG: ABC transporter permease [Candidatus Heimdallarchaeum endolithica]
MLRVAREKRKTVFENNVKTYMEEHRLPPSMSWVAKIAIAWKHYSIDIVVESLAIFVFLLIFLFVTWDYTFIWILFWSLIVAGIWGAVRFSIRLYKQTAMQKELIIAKDGTLRERSPSNWSLIWRRYKKNKVSLLSGSVVAIVTLIAIIYPILLPFNPVQQVPLFDAWNGGGSIARPNLKYPAGTDILGRDEFSRVLAGSEVSLTVGVFSTVLSVFIGVSLGAIAGYYRGWSEEIIMRITDMFLSLPFLVIAILAVAFIRRGRIAFLKQIPQSMVIIIVLGIFGWGGLCRLVTANTKQIYRLDYVNAARVLGASNRRIILLHILPNILAPIIVIATLSVAGGILSEAGLTFLGLGSPTTISWGQMVNEAQTVFRSNPELAFIPGFSIFFVVLAFNLLGDALRDAMDPRLKE